MNKTISIFCVYLIVFSSVAFAQQDIFGYEETGESILVEVEDYEPKVVPAAILNDQDVPIYVYLKGTSLGGLLGLDIEKAPFYNLPKIKDVKIWPNNTRTERFYAGFNYIKPRGREYTSADGFIDLGYLIVYLQKFDESKTVRRTVKEGNETKTITEFEKLPDRIDLDCNAKVYFDLETSFGNFGEYSLILKEEPNEEEWKKTGKGKFWSGSGYIRASKIEKDKAYLQVYDSYLRSLGTVKLSVGDISKGYFRIRYGQELYDDKFRVRLDGIKTTHDKVMIRIYKDGKVEDRDLIEGMKIYPSSDWTVDKISYVSKGGRFEEVVEIENSKGDRKYLYREYTKKIEKIEKGSTEVEIGPPLPQDEVMNKVNIYEDDVNKVLEDYKNIDANLVKAIIAVESSGNFRAISYKEDGSGCGAVGLMQLMPGTAKQYGLKVFEDSDIVECDDAYTKSLEEAISGKSESELKSWVIDERFNPEKNIEAGVKYLNYLLDSFDNNLELAIAAYNAGEVSINNNCKGKKFDDCKNLLPKQTQEYVPKVLDYLELFGGLQIQFVEEEKIEVKEDVCEGNTIDVDGINEDTKSIKFYCTAIKELKE